jgi:hypothetical protein
LLNEIAALLPGLAGTNDLIGGLASSIPAAIAAGGGIPTDAIPSDIANKIPSDIAGLAGGQ